MADCRSLLVAGHDLHETGGARKRRRGKGGEDFLGPGARLHRAYFNLLCLACFGAQGPELLRDAVSIGQFGAAVDAATARDDAEVQDLARDRVAAAGDLDDQRGQLGAHDGRLVVARHHVEAELIRARCGRRVIAAEQAEGR